MNFILPESFSSSTNNQQFIYNPFILISSVNDGENFKTYYFQK